jgi:energy-coupling factor transporter ATP-binding protein EcfA2
VALIGASGSGKSTAVRSVAYLLEPARPCASADTTHKGEASPAAPRLRTGTGPTPSGNDAGVPWPPPRASEPLVRCGRRE